MANIKQAFQRQLSKAKRIVVVRNGGIALDVVVSVEYQCEVDKIFTSEELLNSPQQTGTPENGENFSLSTEFFLLHRSFLKKLKPLKNSYHTHALSEPIELDFCFELFSDIAKFFHYSVVRLGKLKAWGPTMSCWFTAPKVKITSRLSSALTGETDLEETFENLNLKLTPYRGAAKL